MNEVRLLRLFSVVSLFTLTVAIAALIADDGAYASTVSGWQIFKWNWLPNFLLLFCYFLTTVLAFSRTRWGVFFILFIIYPYGYEAIILFGRVTVSGLSYWMSYATIVSRLFYFSMALVLIFIYLKRWLRRFWP